MRVLKLWVLSLRWLTLIVLTPSPNTDSTYTIESINNETNDTNFSESESTDTNGTDTESTITENILTESANLLSTNTEVYFMTFCVLDTFCRFSMEPPKKHPKNVFFCGGRMKKWWKAKLFRMGTFGGVCFLTFFHLDAPSRVFQGTCNNSQKMLFVGVIKKVCIARNLIGIVFW